MSIDSKILDLKASGVFKVAGDTVAAMLPYIHGPLRNPALVDMYHSWTYRMS